jgi:hypothetical protein
VERRVSNRDVTGFAWTLQTATLRCGRIEYFDRPIATLRRNGPTARQTHAGLIPACGAVSKDPAPFKNKCQYWSVKTRDEVGRRAEPLCKYSKVSFCDGSFYDPCRVGPSTPTCGAPLLQLTRRFCAWCVSSSFRCACVSSFPILGHFFWADCDFSTHDVHNKDRLSSFAKRNENSKEVCE